MKDIVLDAQPRAAATKGEAKSIRRTGRVPAIAYGDKEAPVSISVDEKSVQSILHSKGGRNALITLKIGSTSHPVLIKEIQRHPITRSLQHVDFHRISLKEKIETKVPLHVKGEAPGVKLGGGVLEHLVREIRVRCLPTEIPASVDVDISTLQLNQALRAKDLPLPKGVEILMDAESVIVHVVTVHIVEETVATPEAAAAGATPGEPEVIKKGKVEEGAEGAAPAAGDKKAAAAPGAKPAAGAPAAKPEAKKPEGK
jgi:large subunit ribosomal protein L25